MNRFVQQRHRAPAPLERPRELIVACPPMHGNVNLSRIVRTAGCCGVPRIICCGTAKVSEKIARQAAHSVRIEVRRTLAPVLKSLRAEGYQLVGLEQTSGSVPLPEFRFDRRSVLVVGNERQGLTDDILELLDHVVEIPVYGLPHAYNAATAASIAMYEYCRQFPRG